MSLYEFLEMMDFSAEVEVLVRDDKGKELPLCIGYSEEIQDHLKLSYSTGRYKAIQIGIKDDHMLVIVIEE